MRANTAMKSRFQQLDDSSLFLLWIQMYACDTKEEVMRWMPDIQLGRRNLSPIQRIAVAEKYRPIYEKKAKENQGSRTDLESNNILKSSSKSENEFHPMDVRAESAKTAGVSTDTYSKGKKFSTQIMKNLNKKYYREKKA